jgi:dihydroorotase
MQFDLLLKGGRVIDPANRRDGLFDVALKRDRIAAVDANIPVSAAIETIDVTGKIVTPGLIDLHTHVYHGATYWGILPDPVAARSGVTTWLDVGSAGAYNLLGFRDWIVRPSHARIYALLNISSIGLTAPTYELSNLNYCDVDTACMLVNQNRDFVLGIKARIDKNTVGQNGLQPLQRAREAADRLGLPMMVHIGIGPPEVHEVLDLMRPRDILTHCCTGHSMKLIDDQGHMLQAARAARDRGVILDIGHGAGSFSFATAEAMAAEAQLPDVISTDIHQISIHGPLFDMPTCLSKFLALGLTLEQVIAAATIKPAIAMGLGDELGTLSNGRAADVAVFTAHAGRFTFYDVFMQSREGRLLLENTLTISRGRRMPRTPDGPTAPWIMLSDDQIRLIERGHTPATMRSNGD